jgi:hypothetical protein
MTYQRIFFQLVEADGLGNNLLVSDKEEVRRTGQEWSWT